MYKDIAKDRMEIQHLNKFLSNELAAVGTYRRALKRHRPAHDRGVGLSPLCEMLMDHQEAAARLRAFVQSKGGQPSNDVGVWCVWPNTVMGAAKNLDKVSLTALKDGEESALNEYEALAGNPDLGPDVKQVITPIIRRQQKHIAQLGRLIEIS